MLQILIVLKRDILPQLNINKLIKSYFYLHLQSLKADNWSD